MGKGHSSDSDGGGSGLFAGMGVGSKKSNLFTAYINFKSNGGDEKVPLPDNMKASTLMEQIACERNWSYEMIEKDLEILEKNRLFTVSDLRVLSKYSWKDIELLPIVKDLIISAIKTKFKKEKKKKYMSSDSSEDEVNGKHEVETTRKHFKSLSVENKPSPGSVIPNGSKIKVVGASGKVYEADRYCPHKGVDMSRGQVVGDSILCPKHKWEFKLDGGGRCTTKSGYSLRACQVNDW